MLGCICLRLGSLTVGPAMRACVQATTYEHVPRRNWREVGKQVEGQGPSKGVIPKEAKF